MKSVPKMSLISGSSVVSDSASSAASSSSSTNLLPAKKPPCSDCTTRTSVSLGADQQHVRVARISSHVLPFPHAEQPQKQSVSSLRANHCSASSSNVLAAKSITISDFSNVGDPGMLSGSKKVALQNFVNGEWATATSTSSKNNCKKYIPILDPLNGEEFIHMPDTGADSTSELAPFLEKMRTVPKSGLHNPLNNVDRYTLYGEVSFQLAKCLDDPAISDHFTRLIQRVVPKSYAQAYGEVKIVAKFLQNFGADQVRFLARGFTVSGDHDGQQSQGYRFPYGAVMIIAPFNFPLEIPVLQLMGALYMGNHVTIKGSEKCSIVLEEWLRLMLKCGMPKNDVNLLHGTGVGTSQLVKAAASSKILRCMQFTGSNKIARELLAVTEGKVKIEDAGFNWKVFGPDVDVALVDYIAWMCDQDAYANCGQKCSATSILILHKNWSDCDLVGKMKKIASERTLEKLTVTPVLTQTTEQMLSHLAKLQQIPGAKLLFGGKELRNHKIPKCYGAIEPTAVFVPLREILKDEETVKLVTTEIFGPFQVVTEYGNDTELEDCVFPLLEKMENHLTACVCSNDVKFQNKVLGKTVNGTTYCGHRGRTTGAPQNHWFGPSSDPRAAGIGSPEAIKLVWSAHREIIHDVGPVAADWKRPAPT
ncbi:unnamed protein product [Amoebophrya sp. A120]|nr:unnamed protein product [Amoebophrya sp. A120]|eukprot:GSA120T00022002001.1